MARSITRIVSKMPDPIRESVRVILKTGREIVFADAGFNERTAGMLTVFNKTSRAVLAEFHVHDLQSWGFVPPSIT
jgi:hypothetical protein